MATAKTIDGVPFVGWFTEDFTLAELGFIVWDNNHTPAATINHQ